MTAPSPELAKPSQVESCPGLTAASAPAPTCARPSGPAPPARPERKGTAAASEAQTPLGTARAGGTTLFATAQVGHSSAPVPGQALTKGLSGQVTPKGENPGGLKP